MEEGEPKVAERIDGKAIAAEITADLKRQVEEANPEEAKVYSKPVLGYLLVGSREDSALYVRMKKKSCDEIGIEHQGTVLPEDATQEQIESSVQAMNDDPIVTGILVQVSQ